MQVLKNRTSLCGLGIRTKSQGGNRDEDKQQWVSVLCCQSTGRFSLCFFVNSSAFFMNFARSLVYSSARSALNGCSGWGMFTRAMRHWITAGERKQEWFIHKTNFLYLCNFKKDSDFTNSNGWSCDYGTLSVLGVGIFGWLISWFDSESIQLKTFLDSIKTLQDTRFELLLQSSMCQTTVRKVLFYDVKCNLLINITGKCFW